MGLKKSTFNVNFLLRKHKMLRNGEAPICMRITVNWKSLYLLQWILKRIPNLLRTLLEEQVSIFNKVKLQNIYGAS